eukprot:4139884-Heterocapsa_arctica.AAC.1
MNGMVLYTMVYKYIDNKLGRKEQRTGQTIKEWKKELMTQQPELSITKLAQQDHMKAGELHTILADGVWTPRRAHKI